MSHRPLLPAYRLVVFDEAHKLYDVAKQMYGCYLATSEFADLIRCIDHSGVETLKKFCEEIRNSYLKLFCKITGVMDWNKNQFERIEAKIDAGQ